MSYIYELLGSSPNHSPTGKILETVKIWQQFHAVIINKQNTLIKIKTQVVAVIKMLLSLEDSGLFFHQKHNLTNTNAVYMTYHMCIICKI